MSSPKFAIATPKYALQTVTDPESVAAYCEARGLRALGWLRDLFRFGIQQKPLWGLLSRFARTDFDL